MPTPSQNEKLLILCRAIPEDSKKYFQTVCVAGVNDKSELRRLYPVPFDPFAYDGGIPFHKKDWITANLAPSDDSRDKRTESRKVDLSSVKVLGKEDDFGIKKVIDPLVSSNIRSITDSGASLGFIKPDILNYEIEIVSTSVRAEQMMITPEGEVRPRNMIKLKQESIYYFNCKEEDGCSCSRKPHRMEIHDWEVNELYRNVVTRDQDHSVIASKMKQKWFDWMTKERDMYIMLGTHFVYKTWMIVSVLYLRK